VAESESADSSTKRDKQERREEANLVKLKGLMESLVALKTANGAKEAEDSLQMEGPSASSISAGLLDFFVFEDGVDSGQGSTGWGYAAGCKPYVQSSLPPSASSTLDEMHALINGYVDTSTEKITAKVLTVLTTTLRQTNQVRPPALKTSHATLRMGELTWQSQRQ
jgi:hypothetical protein